MFKWQKNVSYFYYVLHNVCLHLMRVKTKPQKAKSKKSTSSWANIRLPPNKHCEAICNITMHALFLMNSSIQNGIAITYHQPFRGRHHHCFATRQSSTWGWMGSSVSYVSCRNHCKSDPVQVQSTSRMCAILCNAVCIFMIMCQWARRVAHAGSSSRPAADWIARSGNGGGVWK